MSTSILGSSSFSLTPDVNGVPVMLGTNTPSVASDVFANRPVAGVVGRIFVSTDTLRVYRDTGTVWALIADGNSDIMYQALTSTVAAQSGTTTIPLANTTPTTASGTQIWSQVITPIFSTSRINIDGSFIVDSATISREITACFFRGTTCIGVTGANIATVARAVPITFNITDAPATTAATTYTIRVGVSSAATWYVNQTSTPYFNGMYALNGITVSEIA
jgi:hypothetical protein